MILEEGEDALIENVDGGDGDLRVVEMSPGIPRVAIDDGLQIDLADPLEISEHESVDSDELACKIGLDMTLAELRIETLEQLDVMIGELDTGLLGMPFEPEQAPKNSSSRSPLRRSRVRNDFPSSLPSLGTRLAPAPFLASVQPIKAILYSSLYLPTTITIV